MHAQGLFSNVFSCSPSSFKTVYSKQKLRQTRSLDPALMRHYGAEVEETSEKGDFTWNSVSGRTVGLKPVPLQSLSELERVRLQDVAFSRLLQDCDLGCQITFPKDCHKRKKSLRRKLDSLSKEKSKDKETLPQAFGIALSQVISNDCAHKQRHEQQQREGHRDPSDLMLSFLQLTSASKRANNNKDLSSSNSSLSSTSETPNDSPLPSTPEAAPRTRRRGGVSVDCITDLDDNQSRLLEALQLSLPAEAAGNRNKRRDKKLSLNPIYRQVPRVVDNCCQHLEKYGLQTVGIFRVGSSKKRVRQLREEFDQGLDVHLDEEHSVHEVAALLKEFLRDMPDPLLTRELYTAFINTMLLDWTDQEVALQLLMYLLPPCNSDTLQRLLHFLSTVAAHAQDSYDSDGQENSGNKMTSLNLATIFGPNLLRKQKNSDKEFVVQSFARAEESTAIISVVQRMISTHETLFMVPADLQNEVLMSLLETDPDVVDYLLRRKDSQYSSPGSLKTEESFSLSDDRRLSSDSNKVSSGEVSPYDNNSPVLSDRLLYKCKGDSSPDSSSDRLFKLRAQYKHSGHSKNTPGDTCTSPTVEDHNDSFWGSWHVSQDFVDQHSFTGSHGNVSESQCYGRSEGLNSHQGHSKLSLRRARTSPAVSGHRTHLPVTRSSSTPQEQRGGQRKPDSSLLQRLHSLWGAFSSEDISGRERNPYSAPLKGGTDPQHTEPLRERRMSNSTLSLVMHQPGGLSPQVPPEQPLQRTSPTSHTVDPAAVSGAGERTGLDADQCQSERWHIWQLRSTVNADILTETLV